MFKPLLPLTTFKKFLLVASVLVIGIIIGLVITLKPVKADNKSIVTNDVEIGTPKATLKEALDTLYYGNAEEASEYYITDIPNFTEELKNTQDIFIKTVEHVTIHDVHFSDDGQKAVAVGEIKLQGIEAPSSVMYKFVKQNNQWKIVQ